MNLPRAPNLAQSLLTSTLEAGRGGDNALVHDGGILSYLELDRFSNRFAGALRAAGAARQDRVIFMMDDRPELVAGYLGAVKAGAVAVAVSTLLGVDELRFVLKDSGARWLFLDAELIDTYRPLAGDVDTLAGVVSCGGHVTPAQPLAAFLTGHDEAFEAEAMAPDDMAYWVYTSGTTGRAKAVVHGHGDVVVAGRYMEEHLGVGPGDRVFATSKLFFAYALGHALLGGLKCGAAVVLHPGWPEAEAVHAAIDQYRPDVVFSVPTLYRNLLQEGLAQSGGMGEVRHFVAAGEPLSARLFEQWRSRTGKPILEGIGTSETTFLFIANTPVAHRAGATGKVLPWAQVRLADEDGGEILEADTAGVLWVRMPSVFDGYWNQADKSTGVCNGDWYCTDDVFTFDAQGWWYYRGRRDDMFKVSGQWVNPLDIEQVVLGLDEITDAAVIGRLDEDGLARAVLFAVSSGGRADDELAEHVRSDLKTRIAHHQCPREIYFVDEIPRTETGKIQRFKLRERLEGSMDAGDSRGDMR